MKTENSAVVEQTSGPDEAVMPKARNEVPAAGHPTPPPSQGGRLARLVSVLRARFASARWGLKKGAHSAATGRATHKPGQQELRLENVKVCRNDLTDADWDLAQPPKSGARLAFLRNLASTGSSGSRRKQMAVREASGVRP